MKRLLATILTTIYSIVAICGSGMVYCQGSDGHSAIEPMHESSHCGDSHGSHTEHSEDSEHDHPCEPCVDTPVQLDDQIVSKGNDQPDTVAFAFIESQNFIPVPSICTVQFPIPPPRPSSTLANLRTVILLV